MLLRFLKNRVSADSNTTDDNYVFGSVIFSFALFCVLTFYIDKITAFGLALTFGDLLFALCGIPLVLLQIFRIRQQRKKRVL